MAPTSTPPPAPAPAEATSTAHAVGGAFFRPADVASSSDVGIGTLLGGGETEHIGYSIDVKPGTSACPVALFLDGDGTTTMGADAGAGFLGLRAGAGRDWRCCCGGGGEAWWRCAGRGRSGGCGKGLRAIVREAEFVAVELLLKDFKPLSISQCLEETSGCSDLREKYPEMKQTRCLEIKLQPTKSRWRCVDQSKRN